MIHAPWTKRQVLNLDDWQMWEGFPQKCPNRYEDHNHLRDCGLERNEPASGVLLPYQDGFHCPHCDYRLTVAPDYMLNERPSGSVLEW